MRPARDRRPVELSPSELLVLRSISHGLSVSETATAFGWSFMSVSEQLRSARRHLAAKNTAHAIALAFRHGLLT